MGKEQTVVRINAMTCGHCKAMEENNLSKLSGEEVVTVDLATGEATIQGKADADAIRMVVEELGFSMR